MEFRFNYIYKDVFNTDKRYIDILGGRGRGGSHFATEYALYLITRKEYFRGYFVRQVFSDIRDSLFRDFKDRIDENETINIGDFLIQENSMRITYIPTGNMIMSKGVAKDGSRTAKMKSLAGATHVFIEESDELKEQDFDQLDLSLRTIKSDKVQIIRVFNPPFKKHWIWRDYNLIDSEIDGYYIPKCKSDSDILSVWSTYQSNLRNLQESTVKKFESFKETNPEHYYNQIKGLVPEGLKGRIYSNWRPITINEFNNIEARTIYCLDFGYSSDPNALVACKFVNDRVYARELLYLPGIGDHELCKKMKSLGITGDDLIIADPGNGGDLRIANIMSMHEIDHELLFNIWPAIKGSGSVNVGITKLKESKVFMTEDSVNGWNEYREYKWALDAEKEPTNTPVDKNNHIMDAIRYGVLAKGSLF